MGEIDDIKQASVYSHFCLYVYVEYVTLLLAAVDDEFVVPVNCVYVKRCDDKIRILLSY